MFNTFFQIRLVNKFIILKIFTFAKSVANSYGHIRHNSRNCLLCVCRSIKTEEMWSVANGLDNADLESTKLLVYFITR
jgi:hypothetical protein